MTIYHDEWRWSIVPIAQNFGFSAPSRIVTIFIHEKKKYLFILHSIKFWILGTWCTMMAINAIKSLIPFDSIESLLNCTWGLCQWTYWLQINRKCLHTSTYLKLCDQWWSANILNIPFLLCECMPFEQFKLNPGQSWIR